VSGDVSGNSGGNGDLASRINGQSGVLRRVTAPLFRRAGIDLDEA
jgi:hypothetical protein